MLDFSLRIVYNKIIESELRAKRRKNNFLKIIVDFFCESLYILVLFIDIVRKRVCVGELRLPTHDLFNHPCWV